VFRDITQLVETQERSRRVVQQTIDALVRTIEEADPFLGGHSRIMGGIASLMAKQLRLSDAEVATVEAAANLSQIGKMFVPREILLKPGILTPEEKQEMEKHVEYARNVLKGIEFDLPVVEAIYEMNERLDGRGYPRGLSGDQISMDARVLAVANAFTAMAKPRSYRPALPVNEVIATLERQTDSYDQNVVEALKQVIATPAGERLVEQAAHAKAV
jgi:HD-GYP domain-containing protein (c-di-GMP phosphodiesterase class II)